MSDLPERAEKVIFYLDMIGQPDAAATVEKVSAALVAAEGRIEKVRHILGSGYGDWRDADADLRVALSVPVDEGIEK